MPRRRNLFYLSLSFSTQYLGWLESEYESFIMAHSDFHDTSEKACALRAEYQEFQKRVEPTCRKVDRVIDLLTQLSPKVPSLASTIDQLCQAVSDRVKKIKDILSQCFNVLDMFAKFCGLYKEVRLWASDWGCGLELGVVWR